MVEFNKNLNLHDEPKSEVMVPTHQISKKEKKTIKTPNSIEFGVEYNHESVPERIPSLEGYKYSISYLPSMGPRRRRRLIHWKHEGCQKNFSKIWNFLDHARMHLGLRPYQWQVWKSSFTQKGNLKKHMKVHLKDFNNSNQHSLN